MGDEVAHGTPGGVLAINQLTHPWASVWSGLATYVAPVPRPPPTCPTIMIEVGILFGVALPVGVNDRLFVRLICNPPGAAVGTVMTTGDHCPSIAAAGFSGAHLAVEMTPAARVPHV